MNYQKLMKSRKSTREYKEASIDENKLNILLDYFNDCKKLVPDINIEVILFEDGEDVFSRLNGMAGYNGMMIKAPSYIIIVSEVRNGYIENTGFVGENMILKAEDEGIATCWISFQDSDAISGALELDIDKDKEITGIISLGYTNEQTKVLHVIDTGENYSKANMQIVEDNTSFRYGIEDIVFFKEWGNPINYDYLEQTGLMEAFSYVRLAPSTLNSQPWKFILDENILVLTIKDGVHIKERDERLDAGIVMLYFYLMVSDYLYDVKWHLGKPNREYKVPKEYRVVSWAGL